MTIDDDKLYSEYSKEIARFTKDMEELKKEQVLIEKNINKMAVSPKIMDIIKSQRHVNDKYIRQLQQAIDYLKIRQHIREKFIADNGVNLSQNDLDKDFATYLKNKSTNPEQLSWEKDPVQINTGILQQDE